uniref:hypothetical protein n=1 Tax=Dorea longicatena TaxID=88431 RepID=UPI00359C7855
MKDVQDFQIEWRVLLAVTISGLIYNLGLLAGPWFEGKMTGCLVDILKGTKQSGVMLYLVTDYVAVIAVAAGTAILLLDEITANLDAETEQNVLMALKKVSKDRTVISISHRMTASMGRTIFIS